jgi:hypothetical protein
MTDTGRSLAASQDHCHLAGRRLQREGRRCSAAPSAREPSASSPPSSLAHPGPSPGRRPVASGFLAPKHPDTLRAHDQLGCLTRRTDGGPVPRERRPSRLVTGARKTAQISCTLGNRSSGWSGTAIASPAEYALDEVSGQGAISHILISQLWCAALGRSAALALRSRSDRWAELTSLCVWAGLAR